jgi:O-antigen/teichoic acid export membrane protein
MSGVINIALTVLLFMIFPPRLWFASVASIFAVSILTIWFMFVKKKLLPDLQVKKAKFSVKRLVELTVAGIWRSLSQLGDLLMAGFDLLICNLLISPVAMGVLSISRVVPTLVISLSSQLTQSFCPALVVAFSKGNTERMLYEIKRSSKILVVVLSIPIVGVIIFGSEFFSLWQPTQDASLLQILSTLGIFSQAVLIATAPLNNVYIAINKNMPLAVAGLIAGGLNLLLEIVLVKYTNLGIFAIAGISSFLILLRNVCYTTPKAARLLNVKWYSFSYMYLYGLVCSLIVGVLGFCIKSLIRPNSWLTFFIAVGLTGVLALGLNVLCVFNKKERQSLIRSLMARLPNAYFSQ